MCTQIFSETFPTCNVVETQSAILVLTYADTKTAAKQPVTVAVPLWTGAHFYYTLGPKILVTRGKCGQSVDVDQVLIISIYSRLQSDMA
jgi:hypothetical protein